MSIFVFIFIVFFSVFANGESNQAVLTQNHELSAGIDNYFAYGNNARYSRAIVSASGYIPLNQYVGGKLNASASRLNGNNGFANNDGYSFTGTVFYRDPEIIKISALYTYARSNNYDLPFSASYISSVNSYAYGAEADYYLNRFTISGVRSFIRSDVSSAEFNDTKFLVGWYPEDNLKIGLSAPVVDNRNIYGFFLEFQPSVLQNSSSITLNYTGDSKSSGFYYGLNFSYFFDTRVTLFTRDRNYR